jgi:transposase-like protein
LLERLESGQGVTPEERLDIAAWQQVTQEIGIAPHRPEQAVPWLQRLQPVLFSPLEGEEEICCPQCGSTHVGRKGLQGRPKRFIDEQGQMQTVEVFRYRCHNRQCPRDSFTVYPPGLVPYSPFRAEVHLLALQMYAWGRSAYRLTGKALGVKAMTAYRWVSACGAQLLPVAALLGVVRSSGVVGVDEKWVLVPKNTKPPGERRQWMYVYLAVDVYTYDLLHIAIYPENTKVSAQTFLLALRAKGYHPQVVVTDLRQDYGPVIEQVFPQAEHHECMFHALQALHRHLADVYGWKRVHEDQEVIALREAFDRPLRASTAQEAQSAYEELMAQRERYVEQEPRLAAVFDALERHWPKLINGIESELIPRTNNTAELVIRRFNQHYQNFCGFDSLATASRFLGVFEKIYRFTPFTDDADLRLRGRSPLQVAGYDVGAWPMTAICSGYAFTASPPSSPECP